MIGALGDIHGDFPSVRRILQRHADIQAWLCVGDLPGETGGYEPVDAPIYFIKGNNEDFDVLAAGALPAHLHYVPNGVATRVAGLKVAGLGGTLAPTWYETSPESLPHAKKESARSSRPSTSSGRPELVEGQAKSRDMSRAQSRDMSRAQSRDTSRAKSRDDKRRHFVRAEVDACRKMRDVDIFLSHEAPRPFRVGRMDAGKTPINEVLADMQPRLHLFGHHHRFSEQQPQGVRSVGLDLVSRSYLLIDANTLAYQQLQS